MRGTDLRPAAVAAGVWLAALWALRLPAVAGLALAVGLLAGAGCVEFVARRGRGEVLGLLVVAMLGAGCGAGVTAWKVAVRDDPALTRLIAQKADGEAVLVVADDPRRVRGGVAYAGESWAVPVRLESLRPNGGPVLDLGVRAVVFAADPVWRSLLPGQRVVSPGRVGESRVDGLEAAVWFARDGPREVSPPPWWQTAAGGLRDGLRRVCARLPEPVGGLLPGLVVGDVGGLDPGLAADFRTTGLVHLTAVSGSNVALVVGAILACARAFGAPRKWAVPLAALALVAFVVVVRPSPSVLRAAVMGGLGLLALVLSRRGVGVAMLSGAVGLLVLLDPGLAGEAGFALSVLATGGILLLAPPWRRWLRSRGWPSWLAEALIVPAAAQLAVAPVVAGLSGVIGIVAVPVNALAVPAVAPATVLGVLVTLLAPWWAGGAYAVAWLASVPAWWLVWLARQGARLPLAVVPWPAGAWGGLGLAVLLIGGGLALRWRRTRRWAVGVLALLVVACAGAVPVRLLWPGWPPRGAVLVACDVGQGDALVLPVGGGSAIVVDAGPEPVAVDGCLRRLGVGEVPLLVVSHFHLDHIGGLAGVVAGRRVGRVLLPGYGEPAEGRAAVLAALDGVPAVVAAAGQRMSVGPVALEVLGPRSEHDGTRSDPNNNSIVLRATVGTVRVLLAGDVEEESQREQLADGAALTADVLKVAHHGSPYQDDGFLAAVSPRIALISVGEGNAYGHPSGRIVRELEGMGARVWRTDRDGDVAVLVGERGLGVVTGGKGRRRRLRRG
ncbi:competence protein ComEC [Actinorhabdospora filicis]|uniref:Competence protein ComEC n=1 Tax=Actinorhabdospora filicis TaxID=1785913 RepID=A0A9W6SN97_9ACTN|nr:ComEC/Rec2 family competence protein [Actinorhabdospora filicis]GLZ79338.1 competence protein ComEC [Actinorhabdospora filicis]